MDIAGIQSLVARGRTDLVPALIDFPEWKTEIAAGRVNTVQWCIYYGDVTALRCLVRAGADLVACVNLDEELGNAAFFGHWKACDFLIGLGADVNAVIDRTGERPLHNALAKAGRPYYLCVIRLLVEHGADVNAPTVPGIETGAFMRDVRTCGETPLHRAAAYADADTICYLIDHGADKSVRDANGDSPLSWASRHLRPGEVLELLAFGEHRIGPGAREMITSDHGAGWGNGMERKLLGDFVVLSSAKVRKGPS